MFIGGGVKLIYICKHKATEAAHTVAHKKGWSQKLVTNDAFDYGPQPCPLTPPPPTTPRGNMEKHLEQNNT